ncbi:hypothetical protein PHLGIDRAFT_110162 [Phlebiopsis gigantea 11061_1 CR5-6]|uniref:Amidohydrolase-related domain-containing protein n=1 Tax=Phlebiopsis gigantea (strain 11061_1 CR5-6) TaxID=745531 RepID=A0A0C3NGW2_PHLG1|nr:hypothetical protein PHLGIDRAFT_110162 [Phlebiopsis gigantea 11061_1 CR5-6]
MHRSAGDIKILAGELFDSYAGELVKNKLIFVSPDSGLIVGVDTFEDSDEGLRRAGIDLRDEATIDLRGLTVLPGFVDTHVHLFLHPYTETSWTDQVTRESLAERTIRATIHARRTLMAGYTTVRDLGTEGALDADLALRKCLSGPDAIAVGPRYFTASRAIVGTGFYGGPKNILYPEHDGVEGIMGAEVADGEVECVKAVRRQIGAGADWIKVYKSYYRVRANMADVSPRSAGASLTTFTDPEVRAMVTEAHRLGVKIVAHASEAATIRRLLADPHLHVDSIEHGYGMLPLFNDETSFNARHVFWVPTLATSWTTGRTNGGWDRAAQSFKAFLRTRPPGVRVACGGDTGVFAHGDNALEMKVMVRLGASWKEVLQWCTLGGWECVRSMHNEMPFGAIRKGFAADIIATRCSPADHFENSVDSKNISFVMKGGKVYKRDGKETA